MGLIYGFDHIEMMHNLTQIKANKPLSPKGKIE
jgi:predicted small metal-binding protein